MITFSEEYLRRLADIQNEYNLKELVMLPEDEPRFIIDLDTRKIILPDEFKFLAVENDHNAETIYFEIDRYYDKQDLSQKTCIVQYKNTSDTKAIEGFYPVTKLDVDTVPGKILFGWTIENKVTVLPGSVDFSIRFYSINDSGRLPVFTYNINTLTGSLPVIDTLNTSNQGVEVIPGKVESLTAKFEALAKQAESNVLFSDDAAKKAAASAEESKASADAAKTSAAEAKESAKAAQGSEQSVAANAAAAKKSELAAAASQQAAADSAASAKVDASTANTKADEAAKSAAAAKASEIAAANSERNAKLSETNAATSESNSAKSEQASKTAAANSEKSAQESLNSANASKESQDAASASANAAKVSETNAKASEIAAAKSAAAAQTSETNSAKAYQDTVTAKTEAANSATNAAASAAEAQKSQVAAATSQQEAAKSEQKATASANKSEIQANRAQSEADRAKAEADRAAAGGSIQIKNIVIPTVGWNQETDGSGGYTIDVAVEGAIETMFPSVSIHRTALSVAQKAGLCPSVQLLTGFLRFWALSPPTSNIPVTVALMTPGCLSGRGCTYVLPPATATQLGGVKIGSGITAAVDGTITASAGISSEEVVSGTDIEKMLDEIFPTDI